MSLMRIKQLIFKLNRGGIL